MAALSAIKIAIFTIFTIVMNPHWRFCGRIVDQNFRTKFCPNSKTLAQTKCSQMHSFVNILTCRYNGKKICKAELVWQKWKWITSWDAQMIKLFNLKFISERIKTKNNFRFLNWLWFALDSVWILFWFALNSLLIREDYNCLLSIVCLPNRQMSNREDLLGGNLISERCILKIGRFEILLMSLIVCHTVCSIYMYDDHRAVQHTERLVTRCELLLETFIRNPN